MTCISFVTSECGWRSASKSENLLDEDDFSFPKDDCSAEEWAVVQLSLRVCLVSKTLRYKLGRNFSFLTKELWLQGCAQAGEAPGRG
jgi:hypothetical protein